MTRFEHHGFSLEFNPEEELWVCTVLDLRDKSYKSLLSKIDNYQEIFSNYKEVIYWDYNNNPEIIKILKLTEIKGSRGLIGLFPDKVYPIHVNPKYVWPNDAEVLRKLKIAKDNLSFMKNQRENICNAMNHLIDQTKLLQDKI